MEVCWNSRLATQTARTFRSPGQASQSTQYMVSDHVSKCVFRISASFLSQHIDNPHKLCYNRITLCTALHSVWNARSTVQTEQAMTFGHGAGPLNGGNRSHTTHLWDSCMFHGCVFYTFGTTHLKLVPIRVIIIAAHCGRTGGLFYDNQQRKPDGKCPI